MRPAELVQCLDQMFVAAPTVPVQDACEVLAQQGLGLLPAAAGLQEEQLDGLGHSNPQPHALLPALAVAGLVRVGACSRLHGLVQSRMGLGDRGAGALATGLHRTQAHQDARDLLQESLRLAARQAEASTHHGHQGLKAWSERSPRKPFRPLGPCETPAARAFLPPQMIGRDEGLEFRRLDDLQHIRVDPRCALQRRSEVGAGFGIDIHGLVDPIGGNHFSGRAWVARLPDGFAATAVHGRLSLRLAQVRTRRVRAVLGILGQPKLQFLVLTSQRRHGLQKSRHLRLQAHTPLRPILHPSSVIELNEKYKLVIHRNVLRVNGYLYGSLWYMPEMTRQPSSTRVSLQQISSFWHLKMAWPYLRRPLGVGLAVSLVVALFSLSMPNYYRSEARILPADTRSGVGIGAALAAAAAVGISIPGQETADSAYVDILNSRTIQESLLRTRFSFKVRTWYFGKEQDRDQSLYDFLKKKNIDQAVMASKKLISVNRDNRTKLLIISVETESAQLSQKIAQQLVYLLDEYVVIKSQSRGGLKAKYAEARLSEARNEMATTQDLFQVFLERNRNYTLSSDASVRLKGLRLENEFRLRTQIVSTLAIAREQALLEEKNDIPILNVLDPGNLPIDKSRPPRGQIVLMLMFISSLITLVIENKDWIKNKFFDSRDSNSGG